MDRKQGIIVSIVGLFIVLLALVGLTYGYYLTRIIGNTNTNSIYASTADLRLVYSDGTTQILTKENIVPGTTIGTKDFTVTNDGNADIAEYQICLENVINTFTESGQEDLKLKITCTSKLKDGTTGTCNGYDGVYPVTNSKLITNSIKVDEVQTYVLKMEYIETGYDQSEDMGKTLSGKI